MEKFLVVIKVTAVFKLLIADAFEGGNSTTHSEVFVEGLSSPIVRRLVADNGFETVTLITRRRFDPGPIEKGRGKVEVKCCRIGHLATLPSGDSWIGNDQWHAS